MPTESQLQDTALRLHIRQRVESEHLPCCVPKHIAAGYGTGHLCVACDQPITDAQVEYEVEEEPDGRRLSFHFGCYVVWQLECARVAHNNCPRPS
jgi:hypothetical protein